MLFTMPRVTHMPEDVSKYLSSDVLSVPYGDWILIQRIHMRLLICRACKMVDGNGFRNSTLKPISPYGGVVVIRMTHFSVCETFILPARYSSVILEGLFLSRGMWMVGIGRRKCKHSTNADSMISNV